MMNLQILDRMRERDRREGDGNNVYVEFGNCKKGEELGSLAISKLLGLLY